jgi:hypothetical protein
LNRRHGRGVSRLSFRCRAKRDIRSFLRRRDTFEEGWRVRENSWEEDRNSKQRD